MPTIFYIDPQSYNNLSIYDTSLLEHVHGFQIVYFHNVKYQCSKLPGITYRGVFSYSDKSGVLKGLSYLLSILQIAWLALTMRPRVVHIQWFRLHAIDSLFVRFLHVLGIKVVHTAHNVLPHNPKPKDKRHYGWYYRHADSIIVHTHRTRQELISLFALPEEKVQVIAHGILPAAVDEQAVEAKMETLRRQLHADDKIIFASMGFQNYYKGIDIIADVWSSTPQLHANPRCMLFVIGKAQNADLSTLEKYDNVVVVNEKVPDVDFDAYLRLTTVALLPYREISQSGVLLTALQRHVPVMVSDVGGLTDPLEYGNVGWNIGTASKESLQESMLQLVDEPDRIAEKQRRDEFEKVKEAFSWKSIGEKTSKLYAALFSLLLLFHVSVYAQRQGPALWILPTESAQPTASSDNSYVRSGNRYLARAIECVTAKSTTFSGDKHNYESLAYYAWPDSAHPGRYIVRDGQPSPEYNRYDAPRLSNFCGTLRILGQAYAVSGDKKYADRCIVMLREWFIDSPTRMNPNLDYGQVIPGTRSGKGYPGVVTEAYALTDVLDCIAVLQQHNAIDKATLKALRQWFSKMESWFVTNPLSAEMDSKDNNLSIVYDVLRYRIGLFTGSKAWRRQIREAFATRLYHQIDPDGKQPKELERSRAMHYSVYNLRHILEFCRMARYDGIDLYALHRSRIDAAVAFIEKYIDRQDAFPYQQITDWKQCQKEFEIVRKLLDSARRG